MLFGVALMLALGLGAWLGTASAAIRLVPILTNIGLSSPLLLTNARDGSHRRFIVEQGGVIKVLQPDTAGPWVFLNITTKVLSGGEQGLLGLAFHPQYLTNRRFFVNYTRKPDGATVIAEYKASVGNPNVADTTETVLLVIPQPFANHNGGMVEFGPDGFLYIGMGDGGAGNDPGNRAQDINNLLGKILRIDVDTPNGQVPYSSPPSNPFFGATPGADEIYAVGMRNPWRFSFDRVTGELYVGDVGQSAREEIDIVTSGGNYGWRIWEGNNCTGNDPTLCNPAGFVFPIVEYSHTGGRCSVTGGYVYRGSRWNLPVGGYVYGDYCTGEIFLHLNGTSTRVLDRPINISSFGEDEAGEVYVVGLGGTVHRFASQATVYDLDGDGKADILWQRDTGTVAAWLLNGTSIAGSGSPGAAAADWTIVGVGDVNGDGKGDIVWRHDSGDVAVWLLNGASIVGSGFVGSQITEWTVAGVADFNGDGRSDILWRHTSGWVGIWLLNGSSIIGSGVIGGMGSDWTVAGVADFNGAGRASILWRHDSGTVAVWLVNGLSVTGTGSPGSSSPDWAIVGVGDVNNDGETDIVWRHVSGTVAVWLLNGTSVIGSGSPGAVATDWAVVGVGDVNGDHRADIVWRHASGTVGVWLLNGVNLIGSGVLGGAANDWQIQ
jgi:hypothetical protein